MSILNLTDLKKYNRLASWDWDAFKVNWFTTFDLPTYITITPPHLFYGNKLLSHPLYFIFIIHEVLQKLVYLKTYLVLDFHYHMIDLLYCEKPSTFEVA